PRQCCAYPVLATLAGIAHGASHVAWRKRVGPVGHGARSAGLAAQLQPSFHRLVTGAVVPGMGDLPLWPQPDCRRLHGSAPLVTLRSRESGFPAVRAELPYAVPGPENRAV